MLFSMSLFSTRLFLFTVILQSCLLLVMNEPQVEPGPEQTLFLKPCPHCPFSAPTVEQHIKHQKIHSHDVNFSFKCPVDTCSASYHLFQSLNSHISTHTIRRDQTVGQEMVNYKCLYCDEKVQTTKEYVQHLATHLKDDFQIKCPFHFDDCSRTKDISSISVLRTHISQCHSNWVDEFTLTALGLKRNDDTEDMVFTNEVVGSAETYDSEITETAGMGSADDDEENDVFHDSYDYFNQELVEKYIANFYAKLEGKLLVPVSTVDAIANTISFLSEILQDKLRQDLSKNLLSVGLEAEKVEEVIEATVCMDPLYNAHHKNAPGVCFLTADLRHSYFKKHFHHQDFEEINLRKNPSDLTHSVHYVNVKRSLEILLEDPSVQKCVDASFTAPDSDGSVLRDYTDGSVFRNSNRSRKSIDILLFMDGFNCCESLGSSKKKHKLHGIYLTVGNLKPWMRSFLRAIRLVLFVNDLSLKSERMYKNALSKLIQDLRNLESTGIWYKGELVDVRLQFIQGDNLGQHGLGGFLEGFTATYFCRYCEITRKMYKEDQRQDPPTFRQEAMRTPDSYQANVDELARSGEESVHGIKRDSLFNSLTYFKVVPRLPPCIGHDMFCDGVVDRDMVSMINYFIEKKWITQKYLNMRINGFQYDPIDGRNKPAEVGKKKERLGGHAVQNWALLRLLPFLIGEKVDTHDKVWKLFLLLKATVELIFAPALTREQVDSEMRSKIQKYMKRRSILQNSYKPKHHYFSHFADLFLMYGPLIHMWSLAFEHRHQFFKRVAKICRNFINLGFTLVSKCLLLQSYLNFGTLFPEDPIFSESFPLNMEDYKEDMKNFLMSCNFTANAVVVKALTLNEIKYKCEKWLLLGKDDDGNIYVGKIVMMVHDANHSSAIILKHEIAFWKKYGLYYITTMDPVLTIITLTSELENPCPHAMYEFKDRMCFSLKHAFLNKSEHRRLCIRVPQAPGDQPPALE